MQMKSMVKNVMVETYTRASLTYTRASFLPHAYTAKSIIKKGKTIISIFLDDQFNKRGINLYKITNKKTEAIKLRSQTSLVHL